MVSAAMFRVALGLIAIASANDFLRVPSHEFTERVSEDDVRTSLWEEIEHSMPSSLGKSSSSSRFAEIQKDLQPIYAVLPKNAYGNLEHLTAHYALHRLFMSRSAWAIKGLGPAAANYNASSPAGVMKDRLPSYIEGLFEQRLGGKGFNLHDLAVLAATMEHLVQEDAVQRLGAAFNIHDSQLQGVLSDEGVGDMLETYMAGYILSENLTEVTIDGALKLRSEMPEVFNYWRETQEFVHGVQRNVTYSSGQKGSASKQDLSTLIVAVEQQFGSFFNKHVCRQLKNRLLQLEHHNTGRVKLSDFYKPALDGFWQFQESAGYLRELGVLEEIDLTEPSVMIANYMNAPANCIAVQGFHSVCCKNECEGLLGHLEQQIAAPGASPASIVDLVVGLPSPSDKAPGSLSPTLLRRLDEIAAHHGGTVPLHGRLFAQWMHHVYPRDCPYPHISGTTSPKLPEEWLEATGTEVTASEEEMMQYTQRSRNATLKELTAEELMTWSAEEELLVVRPLGGAPHSPWDAADKMPTVKRSMALFAIAGSLAYALIQLLQASTHGLSQTPQKFII